MTFDIVDIEEFSGRMAKIYSIILEGDEDTLLDQFFEENSQYEEELSEIARKLMVMGENTDKPPNISAYQENPSLNAKAQQMRALAASVNKAIIEKDLKVLEDGTLVKSDFLNLEI